MPTIQKTDDRRLMTENNISRFSFCALIVATFVFLLTGCTAPAFAQQSEATASNSPSNYSSTVTNHIQPSTQNTQSVINSVLNSLAGCMIAGQSLIPGEKCQNEDANFRNVQSSLFDQKSALGFVGKGISTVFTSPLSTKEALADLGSSLGVVKPAYAQNVTGSGSRVIAPVKVLWQIIRNLAYSLYILLFLAVGVMLMFRQKMNPQTVISVQAALPGLIIGLVLITFSYLIAAALVDLAFLFIPMVALIFDQVKNNSGGVSNILIGNREFWGDNTRFSNFTSLFDLSQNANIFSFWKAFTLNIGLYDFFGNTNNLTPPSISSANPLSASFDPAGILYFIGKGLIELGKNGVNLLIAVTAIIALFFQMLNILAQLVRAYITIMVYTFLGPFFIFMSSIPGRGKGIEDWWKTILANSLIFPAVFAGFFFAGMIFDPQNIDQIQFQYTMPLLSGLPVQVLKYIVGFMILLGIPAIPGMVKQAFGVKDIKGFPDVALAGLSAGWNPVSKGITKFTGYDSIMKEREALKEMSLKAKYNDPSDINHLSRLGWYGSLRNNLIKVGQPRYVTEATASPSSRVATRSASHTP